MINVLAQTESDIPTPGSDSELVLLREIVSKYNDILSGAGLGIWHITIKDGVKPRMRISTKMAELLGIAGQKLSEEEIYDAWYNNILPDAIPSVQASVQEMIDGTFSENTYQWHHPKNGVIYVRCGGYATTAEDGSIVLSGYHSDVTKIVHKDKKQERSLKSAMARLSETYGMVNGFSQDFHTIWIVDKETAQMRLVRSGTDSAIRNAVQMGLDFPDFDTAFERYIDSYIVPDERKRMYSKISFDNILAHLLVENSYTITYLRQNDNNEIDYHQVTFANADSEDGKKQFVIGFKNVDHIVREEIAQKKALQEAKDMAEAHSKELSDKLDIINSIAKVFHAMYMVDLDNNSFVELGDSLQGVKNVIGNGGVASEAYEQMCQKLVSPQHAEIMREFTTLSNVKKNLKNREWISQEFLGVLRGWSEGVFIVSKRDENNECTHAIWATMSIDEQKQREEYLFAKANTDELTGLHNRYAYETLIKSYASKPLEDNLIYVAADVNGLKTANDTLGHIAGDELLKGACQCLKQCFGAYGNVYRIGGDEFTAIIHADSKQLERIHADIEETMKKWHGELINKLSISLGYASVHDLKNPTIEQLSQLADERMYEAKAAHYRRLGIKR